MSCPRHLVSKCRQEPAQNSQELLGDTSPFSSSGCRLLSVLGGSSFAVVEHKRKFQAQGFTNQATFDGQILKMAGNKQQSLASKASLPERSHFRRLCFLAASTASCRGQQSTKNERKEA